MINEESLPILGQEPEEVKLPHPSDLMRKLGGAGIEDLPLTDLIALGFTDTRRMEFYISDKDGGYYVKLLPHHEFIEISWKKKWKQYWKDLDEAEKQKEEFQSVGSNMGVEMPVVPATPKRCVWTDKGLMTSMETFQDRHYDHLFDVMHEKVLSMIDLFPGSKRRKEADPWA